MCIRDRILKEQLKLKNSISRIKINNENNNIIRTQRQNSWKGWYTPVSYTHLRAHETVLDLVCRLLLEKKKKTTKKQKKKKKKNEKKKQKRSVTADST